MDDWFLGGTKEPRRHANPVGSTVNGLTVMGLEFASDGILYAVGDSNPKSPTINSLYTVDVKTGALTRVGPTGAPAFFMDFSLDRGGALYGATTEALYSIDVKTGRAAKMAVLQIANGEGGANASGPVCQAAMP